MEGMLPLMRVRAMPWIVVFELAMVMRKHWKRLDTKDRERLAELLKKSQGLPTKLSARERADVRELVAKLEPGAIARSVVPIGRRALKGRR